MSEAGKGRAWDSNRGNFDRNLAVVIGIDHYSNDSIRDLSTAVSDARAIADLLKQQYDYKQSDEKPEVIRLFDKDATLEALRHLFNTRIPEELKPGEGDRLIIYFAGHGLPRSNDDGPEGYLVPHDADPTEPASFLAMRDISKALDKLKCHHLLVILDCCFAGTFRWAGSRKAIPILETIHQEHYYHFIRHPAWQVITSSAHDQEALDVARLKEDNRKVITNQSKSPFGKERHSPFALALLEGLHPGDGSQRVEADLFPDGVVTAHELFVYLQTRVKQLSGEQQAPGIYPLRRDYDKGEFIFTPPGFDPKTLAEALPLNEENNPYRGLKSFDEKHAKLFFGRQALIEELTKRLTQPNQTLTVVLGVSGSGKSSLVKAGLLPHLRSQNTAQKTELWRILEPMRPGESPFTSLARVLLPIVNENLLERLAEVSFLNDIFQQMLKPEAGSDEDLDKADLGKQKGNPLVTEPFHQSDETLIKVANSWCSATPEAKLLLIEDYFDQFKTQGTPQQKDQLKDLYDQILAELGAVNQKLREEPQYLSQLIATWEQKHPGVQLLLVIDQFEELLTRSQDDRESPNQTKQQEDIHPNEQKEWQKFLQVLRTAIENHPQTLRLVLTLRSDFEPRFLSSALERYWKDGRFPVRAMNSDELRQAIENPALKQALYFEELKDDKGNTIGNLVSKLVDEVGQMPGALPLLSFTLSELYVSLYKRWREDQSTDRTLRFADYKALGGVAGALTRRATEEYEALDEKHQSTMRRLMLRMVAIEGGGVARRRVPESELVYPDSEENQRVAQVSDRLVKARLLVKGQETGESYVEPAHDFLVRGWNKLQEWVEEEQVNLALRQRLTPQASDWYKTTAVNSEKDEQVVGLLWNNDPRLDQLNKIFESAIDNWLNDWETKFVKSSIARKQAVEEDLREQLRREKKLRITAELREQAARVENLLPVNPKEALELVIQSINYNLHSKEEGLLEDLLTPVQASLNKAMESARVPNSFFGHTSLVTSVAFHPESNFIVSGSYDGTVRLWDMMGNPVAQMGSKKFRINSVAFSPEGQSIVAGCSDNFLRLWDLKGNAIVSPPQDDAGHLTEIVTSVAVSPNGQWVVSGDSQGKLCLWNTQGNLVSSSNKVYESPVRAISFSPDSKRFVSISLQNELCFWALENSQLIIQSCKDFKRTISVALSLDAKMIVGGVLGKVYLQDIEKDSTFRAILMDEISVKSVAFSPDGEWIICGFSNGNIQRLNLQGNPVSHPFKGHDGNVTSVTVSPDSQLILSSGQDNKLHLWNLQGIPVFEKSPQEPNQPFEEHKGQVKSLAFSPNGKLIVSVSDNGKVYLWDLQGSLIAQPFEENSIYSIAFSTDAKRLIGGTYGGIKLWNLETNQAVIQPFEGHKEEVISVTFSPDGKLIASGSKDGTVRLWDLEGNPVRKPFEEHEGEVTSVTFSPDGKLIASGSKDGTVRLWDSEGNRVGKPYQHTWVSSVAFSPDGKLIASSSEHSPLYYKVHLWDLAGNLVSQLFAGHEGNVNSVAFSPDSQLVLIGGRYSVRGSSEVLLSDLKGNSVDQHFQSLTHDIADGEVSSITFSSDGKWIACGCRDGRVCLWDMQGNSFNQPLATKYGLSDQIVSLTFNSNSTRLIAESTTGKVAQLWNLEGNSISPLLAENNDLVYSAAFSPDGKWIACGGYGKVQLCAVHGNLVGQPFEGHSYRVNSVAFSPDSELIVSSDDAQTICLWSLEGKLVSPVLKEFGATSVTFSPNGKLIVGNSCTETRLWTLDGKPFGHSLNRHEVDFSSVAFSPDGKCIITGCKDGKVRLWNTEGEPVGQPFEEHDDSFGGLLEVKLVAASLDGELIASSKIGRMHLWNIKGQLLKPLETRSYLESLVFSPDSKLIIGTCNDGSALGISRVHLWDLNGNCLDQSFQEYGDWVDSIVFSPDGKLIVCGSSTVRMWSTDRTPISQPLTGHKGRITTVTFSPDGKLIASGDTSGIVRLWRSGWQAWLKVCCDRLAFHLISENPEIDIQQKIGLTCIKHAWTQTDVAKILLRQANELSRQGKTKEAGIKFEQALNNVIAACHEVFQEADQQVTPKGAICQLSETIPKSSKEEIRTVLELFRRTLFNPDEKLFERQEDTLRAHATYWHKTLHLTQSLFAPEELAAIFTPSSLSD
ncbi:hypothetical protein [Leptolyngbya sp. ST-U4]|uniref:nSTAND1 domain-containing NTPase n=1 Tax=Leptolyngbya sp. ST-U4 TaxID=2933912 RepID=UPI0032983364